MGDSHMGLQARLMSQALRKLTAVAYRGGTTLMFLNQLRQKIGVTFGSPETTTGGNALKFYASMRFDVRRIGQVKVGDEPVGGRTRVKVAKNKCYPTAVLRIGCSGLGRRLSEKVAQPVRVFEGRIFPRAFGGRKKSARRANATSWGDTLPLHQHPDGGQQTLTIPAEHAAPSQQESPPVQLVPVGHAPASSRQL